MLYYSQTFKHRFKAIVQKCLPLHMSTDVGSLVIDMNIIHRYLGLQNRDLCSMIL